MGSSYNDKTGAATNLLLAHPWAVFDRGFNDLDIYDQLQERERSYCLNEGYVTLLHVGDVFISGYLDNTSLVAEGEGRERKWTSNDLNIKSPEVFPQDVTRKFGRI